MVPTIAVVQLLLTFKFMSCCSSEEESLVEDDNFVRVINESFIDVLNSDGSYSFKALVSNVEKEFATNKADSVNPKLQEVVDGILINTLALQNNGILDALTKHDQEDSDGGVKGVSLKSEFNTHSEFNYNPKNAVDDNSGVRNIQAPKLLNTSGANEPGDDLAESFWEPSGRRLFKGDKARIADYPFMATVLVFGKFQCAGSIIKSDLIITASSGLQLLHNNRFYRETPKVLSVRVGSTFYVGGGEVIPVNEIYFHPEYVPKTLEANLALLRLSKHLVFTKQRRRVKKIKLDDPLSLPTAEIMAIGWGAKTPSNRIFNPWVNRLSTTSLRYYPLHICRDVYSAAYVTQHNFCAGYVSRGGGACDKDVGGPGVVEHMLVGVISFGPSSCGQVDAPTVFTRVGDYMDWISGIMNKDVPSLRMHVNFSASSTSLPPPLTTVDGRLLTLITRSGRERSTKPTTPSTAHTEQDTLSEENQNKSLSVLDLKEQEFSESSEEIALAYDLESETTSTPFNPSPKYATTHNIMTKDSAEIISTARIDFAPVNKPEEIYDRSEDIQPFSGLEIEDRMLEDIADLMINHGKNKTNTEIPSYDNNEFDKIKPIGRMETVLVTKASTPDPPVTETTKITSFNLFIQANVIPYVKKPDILKLNAVPQSLNDIDIIQTPMTDTSGSQPAVKDESLDPDEVGSLRMASAEGGVVDSLTTPAIQGYSITDEFVKYFYDILHAKL